METNNKQEGHDLSHILKGYHENRWVAIAPDYSRVLVENESLSEVMRRVSDPKAIFHKVLPHDMSFAPTTEGA
jgi:hypothetical protein